MFELPSLKGVEEVVISPEVIEGNAKPLRIYAERLDEVECIMRRFEQSNQILCSGVPRRISRQ